jgi:hypothetical protein
MSNVMSLAPKIDEIRVSVAQHKPDLVFLTETWLKESIGDPVISLPNYNLTRRDRTQGIHGGVCLYSNSSIVTERLMNLEHPDFEVLWVYTRPQRLPRGFPSIITGTVYHPPSSDDKDLLNYLSNSLTEVIGIYPGCGIIIAGDFNRLDINHLCYEFHLKQLVHTPTRGANILDLVLTNLHNFYKPNPANILPPFGLSDHFTVTIYPKGRPPKSTDRRFVTKRDTRPSRKAE